MTFEEWYTQRIGISPADAERRGVWDMKVVRDAWEAATAAERERAAKVCEERANGYMALDKYWTDLAMAVSQACAADIRAE